MPLLLNIRHMSLFTSLDVSIPAQTKRSLDYLSLTSDSTSTFIQIPVIPLLVQYNYTYSILMSL